MLTKRVVWGSLFTLIVWVAPASQADSIKGSGTATFQTWSAQDINDNGKPYWDNKSLNGKKQTKKTNVGFFLTDASTAPLDNAPGELPYWGTSGKSNKKNGGNADLNFFFQREEPTNSAVLKLEVDPAANIDEFGWYDINDPSKLHPVFLGPDSPVTNDTFSPSAQYGLYLKRGEEATFYTQSLLNPFKDS
jgi:predicted RecA/RadA family phage recombinase